MDNRGQHARSPWHMPWADWKAVAGRAWAESGDDNIGIVAAGVAFYAFLALVPLLGAMVLSYGLFVPHDTVIEHIRAMFTILPHSVAYAIGEQLLEIVKAPDDRKGLGLAIALAIALLGARSGAGSLITALNIAYDAREKRGFVKLNLIAIAITVLGVVLGVAAAVAIAVLGALGEELPASPLTVVGGTVLSYALLTFGGAAAAAALYHFGPCRHRDEWIWISPGSIVAAGLWLALTLGFGAYVKNIGRFDATYGSLGAVVALLTWLYFSSYALLFGAELNAEIDCQAVIDRRAAAPASPTAGDAAAPRADSPRPEPLPKPSTTTRRAGSQLAASRLTAHAARAAGLPKAGLVSSGLATLGLAMLRRRGRKAAGATLLLAAAGISLLRGGN